MRKIVSSLLVLGLVWVGYQIHHSAALAVDVSAKWACQCRFINGGEDAFCIAEDPLGLPLMAFYFVPPEGRVRVDIFGIYVSEAAYKRGAGCMVL